jgi:hypothetical protein
MLLHHKKGISIMIGYVLLITFAIIMGGIVYTWMKSYVPTDTIECPDGVSVFIKSSECIRNSDGTYNISVELVNNGLFSINGYYAKISDNPDVKIGTRQIDKVLEGGSSASGVISFPFEALEPSSSNLVKLKASYESIYLIEITPIKYQVIDNRNRLAICGNAKVSEQLDCS